MKLLNFCIMLPLLLSGCGAVGHYQVDKNAAQKADLHFIGIPVVAGAIGSSFPINEHYSLTAGHVAKIMIVKVKAYNPQCDSLSFIIIIRDVHCRDLRALIRVIRLTSMAIMPIRHCPPHHMEQFRNLGGGSNPVIVA